MCPVFYCAGDWAAVRGRLCLMRGRARTGEGEKGTPHAAGAGGVLSGSLTAKGEPVSVGSDLGFPLERAYACPAGRGRGSRCETALPCCGVGGELAGSLTAKGEPVSVGSEPGFSLECACMPRIAEGGGMV